MKLFYTTRSPLAHIVRVIANELDVKLELVESIIRDPSSPLLEFTPAGRVPALQLSDGVTVADHRICCKILADIAERPDVFSNQSEEMACEAEAIALLEAYMKLLQESWRDEAIQSDGIKKLESDRIHRLLNWLEQRTETFGTKVHYRSAVLGCALFFNENFSKVEGIGENYPKLTAWYAAFSNQPAFKSTT